MGALKNTLPEDIDLTTEEYDPITGLADVTNPDDFQNRLEVQADEMIYQAQREYELSKYTTAELQNELQKRGYVNGVLVHPELDK